MTEHGPLSLPETADLLLAAMDAGEKAAVVSIISHPDSSLVGGRFFVQENRRLGSSMDPVTDAAAADLAVEGLSGNLSILPGLHTLPGVDGNEVKVHLELHHPPAELVIVGAGHLAQPLCTLGALLGLRVRVLDDRPDFATRERFPEAFEVKKVDFSDPFSTCKLHLWTHVLLVTRGHRYDFECLRKVLQHSPLPGYIGMIGSRRRVKATFDALLKEGFSREALSQVRAPIGLDIGGETPAEIAVSVAAEIVQLWRGGTGHPLREDVRVLERFFPADASLSPTSKEGDTP